MIRKAQEKDNQRLLELCVSQGWHSQIDHVEEFFEALKYSDTFVYEVNNEVAGFARVISDKTFCMYLCELVVDEKYRHQKIATKLIDELFKLYPNTKLEVLSGCDEFYEAYGFEKKGNGFRKR